MFICHLDYYLLKYKDDGLVEVQESIDMEFEDGLPPDGRNSPDEFLVGDTVRARWRDGEFYTAVVLNVSGKWIIAFYILYGFQRILQYTHDRII